jgi:hypothetical protein
MQGASMVLGAGQVRGQADVHSVACVRACRPAAASLPQRGLAPVWRRAGKAFTQSRRRATRLWDLSTRLVQCYVVCGPFRAA